MTQFVSLRKIKRKIKEMRKITFKMRIYYFADLTQQQSCSVKNTKWIKMLETIRRTFFCNRTKLKCKL